MLPLHGALNQLQAHLPLGRAPRISLKAKGGFAADLPDFRELRQDFYLIFLKFLVIFLGQKLPHMDHLAVVEPLLLSLQAGKPHLLQLIRQVREHIRLKAAQDKGRNHLPQPVRGLLLLVFHNGRLQRLLKRLIGVQISRHQVIKNTPQFAETVLNGRARQSKPRPALDNFHRFGRRCGVIFDVLGLVQNLAGKRNFLVLRPVPLEQVVGGHKHVPVFVIPNPLPPLLLAARNQADFKCGGKPGKFLAPVIYQRGRSRHQRDSLPPFFL